MILKTLSTFFRDATVSFAAAPPHYRPKESPMQTNRPTQPNSGVDLSSLYTDLCEVRSAAICNAIGRVHEALEIAYMSEALRLVVHC